METSLVFVWGPLIKGLLIAMALAFMARLFLRKRSTGYAANWTPLEAVVITIGIYFVAQFAVALLIGLVISAFGTTTVSDSLDTPFMQFVYIACVEAATIGLLYWFMTRRQTPWKAIGLVSPRWRDIGYSLIGLVVYFGVYTVIVYRLLTVLFPQIDTSQQQELGFSTSTVGPELIFVFLSLVILPPIVEEIIVRGFLFTGLRNRLNLVWAALITSMVFAAAHLQWGSGAPLLWTAAADTFVLSLVLVGLRHKTGSLWPGIGLHFIKNGLAFLALFVFKVT